ncbi:MAG: DoxX family protein [Candidatus Pacebacteria bacterium]|nr:DoxX family protein [Candidatus Paceibacterota bacterium]MBP9772885.1 DoxX family protein [Candidatus Paceibacterota bacterium]QQR76378.1 MAG: DoxX family protein [Candidatus Nomurabacteria bacterium]
MKKHKIIFWVTTSLIFIFEGVMPALTSQSEMSIQGIVGLGYPLYFVTLLTVFKVLGSIVLIVPKFPARVKEWAYAGFGIDFICAFVSLWVVAGFNAGLALPVVAFIILALSYNSYHKLNG